MSHPARGDFDPVPSTRRRAAITVVSELPPVAEAAALAVPVLEGADPPPDLGATTESLWWPGSPAPPEFAQVVVEGVPLAWWRYFGQ